AGGEVPPHRRRRPEGDDSLAVVRLEAQPGRRSEAMTKTLLTVLPILLVAGILFLASGSLYFQVYEGQQAIVLQFGRPVGDTITAPGLHMKIPFIQEVRRFDRRLLIWDGDPNQIPTKGREFIWIDTTARWRIADA